MKSIYSAIALIIFGTSGILAQDKPAANVEVAYVSQTRMGAELVETIRHDYESNAYDAFLATLQADYQQMIQSGKLDEFVKMREAPSADQNLQKITERWETIYHKLLSERNEELNQIANGQTDQMIAKRIHSVTSSLPADQKDALLYLASLRFKTPDQAINEDEKKLIEIDIASEFKTVHLNAQYAQKAFNDRYEKHLVINMDALRQMLDAAKSFKDSSLQEKVVLAAQGFDQWQARNWDLNLLNQIIKKPSNDVEKKIAGSFEKFRNATNDLYQKEFLDQVSNSSTR